MDAQLQWILGAALVAIAVGAAGFALGRRTGSGGRKTRELEARLETTSAERQRLEAELRDYRERVADHFGETSQRLHDLTVQYRAVYDHLAKGASELCPESFAKLEGGLGLDSLPEELPRRGRGEAPASGGEEDTDLDGAGAWTDTRPDPPGSAQAPGSAGPEAARGADAPHEPAASGDDEEEPRRQEAAEAQTAASEPGGRSL